MSSASKLDFQKLTLSPAHEQIRSMSFTKHQDKVQFVKSFVKGELDDYSVNRPLMIVGSGANGKSYVIQEVREQSPVNLVIYHEMGGSFAFVPAITPSPTCAILMASNGAPEDYTLAKRLNAHIVHFEKDPAYA